ncbi:lipoprotein [Spiroplasma endosymbiont of Glossina fuscipes fuscipes]|uniref:lipoprotein n=1 Tax=Spiroplasma endosymbiont of Glossina fuscipes fuscipes TaxID=2004463 RepID=UPI003C7933CD
MKRLLSIIGAISLVGTSTTSLVACNKPQQEYTKEELAKLKEENKINTTNQQIKNNLEWIAPQEKPFNKVDNKYYYVVWRGDEKIEWKIIKFQHNIDLNSISLKRKLDHYKEHDLFVSPKGLVINRYDFTYERPKWWEINSNYFKSVYRWNLDTQEPDLIIDNNGNIKINGE